MHEFTFLKKVLINWFAENKRDLPWRDTNNAYYIWISEVILQQTRVNQGINYYYRFIHLFPNVKALANANIDDVLKCWQGLGYYSRARNLHAGAMQIVNDFGGKMPNSYAELIKIKGIGRYTAAAIASIAFAERVPAIDGNVFRVLSRLFADNTSIDDANGYNHFYDIALSMMVDCSPSDFNQALMEFGALVCLPRNPDCIKCPVMAVCMAYQKNEMLSFPVKKQKKAPTDRFFNYFIFEYSQSLFIKKRVNEDIWKGLYEFPMTETKELLTVEKKSFEKAINEYVGNIQWNVKKFSTPVKHQLTHRTIVATFYHIELSALPIELSEYICITKSQFHQYPVPKVIERYMEKEFDFEN
jgi:A/G-specific adenine glycosylase